MISAFDLVNQLLGTDILLGVVRSHSSGSKWFQYVFYKNVRNIFIMFGNAM